MYTWADNTQSLMSWLNPLSARLPQLIEREPTLAEHTCAVLFSQVRMEYMSLKPNSVVARASIM